MSIRVSRGAVAVPAFFSPSKAHNSTTCIKPQPAAHAQVSFLEQAVEDPDPEMAAMAKEDLEGARYVHVTPCPVHCRMFVYIYDRRLIGSIRCTPNPHHPKTTQGGHRRA